MTVSVDTKCSSEGCWYCKYRCHNCFQDGSIGYTYKRADGEQLYHCGERCYRMHTGDIADSTVFDAVLGKGNFQTDCGTHLLLSATVNLHTRLSKNTVMSTQLCVSYNHKHIPSGVLYVCSTICTTDIHQHPLSFLIDHNLSPIKSVWPDLPQNILEAWREKAFIKRALQPVLENHRCNCLPTFLMMKFPSLRFSFMDIDGRIYSVTHNGYATIINTVMYHSQVHPRGSFVSHLHKTLIPNIILLLYDIYLTRSKHCSAYIFCLLYTSPSPRDATLSRMPSSA